MPDEHARLSPSGMHRIIRCPSSLREGENHEKMYGRDESSPYAAEGTAAHELAETCFNNNDESAHAYVDMDAENGHIFTEDMCDSVDEYLNSVRKYVVKGDDMLIEQKLDFSEIVGVPNSFGTADVVVLKADGLEIQVHDLKFGKGVKVYAENNEQGMTYALGALAAHDIADMVADVRIVIHQPRINHYDEWVISVDELRAFGEKLRERGQLAIKIADADDADLSREHMSPSYKTCRWCAVKGSCPAIIEDVVETHTKVEFSNLDEAEGTRGIIEEITNLPQRSLTELAELMKFTDLIVDWAKAVQERVASELHDGKMVVGYKLVEGKKGNRKWTNKEEVEEAMKAMRLKKDEMYKQDIITPTAALKLLKANPRKLNKLNEFIEQSKGSLTVVASSDPRVEVRLGIQANEFDNLDDDLDGLA